MNSSGSPAIFKNYLTVPGNHQIYYETSGNPEGIAILFLQGWHEIGFSNNYQFHFDPAIFKSIILDQRGAGRSKPAGETTANSTPLLLDDINLLLQVLHIKKIFLAAVDNSCITALAYAIKHPYRIFGMILGGVFSANSHKSDHHINGGVKNMFPKEWFRFQKSVPRDKKKQIPKYYLAKMLSEDLKTADKYAFEWARYKIAIFDRDAKKNEIPEIIKSTSYQSHATLEAHYLAHNYFLEDNYIVDNTAMLIHIPTTIIQAKSPVVSSFFAFALHNALPKSKLIIIDADVSDSVSATETAFRAAADKMIVDYPPN